MADVASDSDDGSVFSLPTTDDETEDIMELILEEKASRKRKQTKEGDAPAKKVSFRLQCAKLLLTYKTHIDKEAYIDWFHREKKATKFIRIAHETGDEETPYDHSHVLVHMSSAPNWKDPRCLDYESIHPHIQKLTSKDHWENSKVYLSKEDPENEDLKEKKTIITVIRQCQNFGELLKSQIENDPDSWKYTPALKATWEALGEEHLKAKMHSEFQPNLPWHKDLLAFLEKNPDPRKILWIYDLEGKKGKSQMTKHLYLTDPKKYLIMKHPNSCRDAATIVLNAKAQGWLSHGVILDIPRAMEKARETICPILEDMKDGHMTATKYQGGSVIFPIPHVVVFANWPPHVELMSLDRWDIREIDKDGALIEHPITNYEPYSIDSPNKK